MLKANFGGWKLDLINALNSDPALKPSDVAIAVALTKHLNAGSFEAYPSQETLAEITHMGVRNVTKCLDRLKVTGWLHWSRGSMHKPNVYSFDQLKVGQQIARMKQDDLARRKRNQERRRPIADKNHSSGRKFREPRTTVPVSTRTTVPPNPFSEQGAIRRQP